MKIEFKGIGEEGQCEKCGRDLLNTHHFVVDGEHIIVGSECAKKINIKFDRKVQKEFDRIKKAIDDNNYLLNAQSNWEPLSFLSDDENKKSKKFNENNIKDLTQKIKNLKSKLVVTL